MGPRSAAAAAALLALLPGSALSILADRGALARGAPDRRLELLSLSTRPAAEEAAELVAESQRLSSRLPPSLGGGEGGHANTTLELLSSFRICSGKCRLPEDFRRYGEDRDGGYQMCLKMDGAAPVAGVSLGVGSHDRWSYHVSTRLGVPVHQFDCFRVRPTAVCKNCTLHRTCISSNSSLQKYRKAATFAQMLNESGLAEAAPGSLLLKMDVEGSEWDVLPEVAVADLQRFGQIIVEFHFFAKESQHEQYLAAMRQLLSAGFKVAHLHGNNQVRMYRYGKYQIPDVIEVTLVREPGASGRCESHVADFPFEPLNSLRFAPMPPAELPDESALAER